VGSSSGPENLRTYRVYGLNLESDFSFYCALGEGEGRAELSFTLSPDPVVPGPWKAALPLYRSPRIFENGESVSQLYRLDSWEVLCFPSVADFYLQTDRIVGHPVNPARPGFLEIRFLGSALSYWLERQGFPALHASAVAIDGQAVAFLSRHGGGKTGLAAALMQSGVPLLSDDILPIEEIAGTFHARPGYPQMRMWPDEAAHFLGNWEELPAVLPGLAKRRVWVGAGGFGTFHDAPLPLAGLYLAERQPEGPVEVLDISPRDALIELVRHSFAPHMVEAAGLQPSRFDLFARLVRAVPVRRLVYPSGFDRLPEVVRLLHNLDASLF
jgi:hypothetical protein